MNRLATVLALCATLISAASAQMVAVIPWDTHHGYQGPGDFATFTTWWGLRAYSAAKAAAQANVVDLRRVSDNATCTAKLATNGTLDLTVGTPCNGATQTVTAWIGASSAVATKLYDQTAGAACGGSCDLVQATAARQPPLVLNCNSGLPCLKVIGPLGSGGSFMQAAANFTPAGTTVSMSVVANRISGAGFMYPLGANDIGAGTGRNGIYITSANTWLMENAGTARSGVANDNAWHAANGAIAANPSTSTLNIDGTSTTTTAGIGSTTAGKPEVIWALAFDTLTSQWAEAGFQDNTVWSGTIRTNLCHNQRLYWGTGGTC